MTILTKHDLFKRKSFACDVYNDQYIIVAGGFNSMGTSESAGVYDIKTGTHERLPNLPGPKQKYDRCGGAVLNSHFYVVSNGSVFRMDLSSEVKTWKQISSVEVKLRIVEAVLTNGKQIFAFNENSNMIYDPEQNSWTDLPAPILPRCEFATAIAGDTIYIIGGYASWNYLTSVEALHIPSRSWNKMPPLPEALVGAAAVFIGRWIVVTGGYFSEYQIASKCYIFDTWTQTWSTSNQGMYPHKSFHRCITTVTGRYRRIFSVGGGWLDKNLLSIKTKDLIPNYDMFFIFCFILLRKLVDEGRAYPKVISTDEKHSKGWKEVDIVVVKLVTELPLDMFRTVLSFLV